MAAMHNKIIFLIQQQPERRLDEAGRLARLEGPDDEAGTAGTLKSI